MKAWISLFLVAGLLGGALQPMKSAVAADRVSFNSPPIKIELPAKGSNAQRISVSQDARKSSAYLHKPDGAGPFPVVVALHHSGGITDELKTFWPKFFMFHGYAVLVVDSFSGNQFSPSKSFPQQTQDAIGALDYINSDKSLDAGHVALVGYSSGAIVINEFLVGQIWKQSPPPPGRGYKAAIAFYGMCDSLPQSPKDTLPLLLLVPELDPMGANCVPALGRGFEGKVFPGAYHGFDQYAVASGLRSPSGSPIKADAQVATEARETFVVPFLAKHLKN